METTPHELWHGKKPKLSFLKVWGCEAYVRKLQPDKLESKAEKCIFVGYPKDTVGYIFYNKTEGKTRIAKSGTFLEKEFLAKGVSGRKIELDKIIDPALEIPSEPSLSGATEGVSEQPSAEEVGANNDNDHDDFEKSIRRSGRDRRPPQWYGNPVLTVLLLEHDEPANYMEAMEGPESEKWLEAMKSEMGSMYDNQVWTLVDIPDKCRE